MGFWDEPRISDMSIRLGDGVTFGVIGKFGDAVKLVCFQEIKLSPFPS
jgi:hypothetical protein